MVPRRAADRRDVYGANRCMQTEFDLESKLKWVEDSLELTFDFTHVKGHMNDDEEYDDFP